MTFVDTSRPTSANGVLRRRPVADAARLGVWYPTAGTADGSVVREAPADRGNGPYPLVLFADGYAVDTRLLRGAARGGLLAAGRRCGAHVPDPLGEPGGASHVDYEETFEDSQFVISRLLGLTSADPLGGLVDASRIAVTGHSDGEVIAFGSGYLTCCADSRVKAVIAMAGNLENIANPLRANGPPVLHMMEDGDEFDPYLPSIAVGPLQPRQAALDREPAGARRTRLRTPSRPRGTSA